MRGFDQASLDGECERELQRLAHVALGRPQEQVLDHLHRDGAAAARDAVAGALDGLLDLAPVDAAMLAEAAVLRGDDGALQIGRDAIERHPALVDARAGQPLAEHQRGGGRVDPAVEHDQHQHEAGERTEREGGETQRTVQQWRDVACRWPRRRGFIDRIGAPRNGGCGAGNRWGCESKLGSVGRSREGRLRGLRRARRRLEHAALRAAP